MAVEEGVVRESDGKITIQNARVCVLLNRCGHRKIGKEGVK